MYIQGGGWRQLWGKGVAQSAVGNLLGAAVCVWPPFLLKRLLKFPAKIVQLIVSAFYKRTLSALEKVGQMMIVAI